MDFSGLNNAFANSARQAAEIQDAMDAMHNIQIEVAKKKEMREKDNHDNLDFLSKSAKESNEILKEMNQTLKQNNALLQEKNEILEGRLTDIQSLLQNIFNLDEMNGAEQKELLQHSNVLACEMAVSLENGEKINWLDKAADGGVQAAIYAIGILLRMKGLNI